MAVDIGLRIRNRRKELHISQARLSALSGISQSAISDIENPSATRRPNSETIQKIAIALRCSVSDLMDEEKPSSSGLSVDEEKLISDYRSLNMQGQEYIRQTMYMARTIYKKCSDVSIVEEI